MSRVSFYAFLLPLMAACSVGAPSFSDDHDSEIRFDCSETITCVTSKGGALSAMPENDCVRDTNALLNHDSDAQQALFETTFARCSQFRGCEYVSCASTDASYSASHQPEIMKHCQQTVACQLAQGQQVGSNATDACVMQISTMLDMWNQQMRTVFQTHLTDCATQTACAYVTCQ